MKTRLDQLLVDRNIADSLETARSMIGAGEILVNDHVADKAGHSYLANVHLRRKTRKDQCCYVSRGGLKLECGIRAFDIDLRDRICVDIGASTGGFTDCMLQHGAAKVFAIDVAYGQLSWKIRQDSRVVVIERCNARNIGPDIVGNSHIDFASIDVSFISLTSVLPPICSLFRDRITILALIKPQFELPREDVGQGGVVTDTRQHDKAITKIIDFAGTIGLEVWGTAPSSIFGPKGNREFFVYLGKK